MTEVILDHPKIGALVGQREAAGVAQQARRKVIRVILKDGIPTGEYEDFMTGLVIDDDHTWGRPVGVGVTQDGSLLVSDDCNGTKSGGSVTSE